MSQDFSTALRFYDQWDNYSANGVVDLNKLTLTENGNIRVIYSPFDYIERRAKLVILGITPGMSQAQNALNAFYRAKLAGSSLEDALRKAKMTASFSGPMRANLIEMLDHIGIASLFNVQSAGSFFELGSTDVHFTSALRYPVFIDGKNYSGQPSMMKTPCLKSILDSHLLEEAKLLPNAIWIPLGPKAEEAIMYVCDLGLVSRNNILIGMPHPSGANAERVTVFTSRKRPELASAKTDAGKLLQSASQLKQQIASLSL